MLISDVDEFVVPMGSNRNFEQVLNVPPQYCAFQLAQYTFHGLQSLNTAEEVRAEDRPRRLAKRRDA